MTEAKENSANLQIRAYASSDYPRVRRNLLEGNIFDQEMDAEERLSEKISRDPESILVATIDNKIVGNVFIVEDGWAAFVFRLAVVKEYRNRGIGKRLMQEAEERIRKKGYNELHILVHTDETELQGYYEKLGYLKGNKYQWMYKSLNK